MELPQGAIARVSRGVRATTANVGGMHAGEAPVLTGLLGSGDRCAITFVRKADSVSHGTLRARVNRGDPVDLGTAETKCGRKPVCALDTDGETVWYLGSNMRLCGVNLRTAKLTLITLITSVSSIPYFVQPNHITFGESHGYVTGACIHALSGEYMGEALCAFSSSGGELTYITIWSHRLAIRACSLFATKQTILFGTNIRWQTRAVVLDGAKLHDNVDYMVAPARKGWLLDHADTTLVLRAMGRDIWSTLCPLQGCGAPAARRWRWKRFHLGQQHRASGSPAWVRTTLQCAERQRRGASAARRRTRGRPGLPALPVEIWRHVITTALGIP